LEQRSSIKPPLDRKVFIPLGLYSLRFQARDFMSASAMQNRQERTAKLIECLEDGGKRLKDEDIGLNKRYTKSL